MRRSGGALLLALLLALPTAAAWSAQLAQPVSPGLHLRDGLLVAGALQGGAHGAPFGAAQVDRLFLGDDATVTQCPLNGTQPDASCGGRSDMPNGHAQVRVLSGGLVAIPAQDAPETLASPAGAGLLGRVDLRNLSPPLPVVGPARARGGRARLHSDATAYLLRPFGRDVQVEIRGDAGIKQYNGTDAVFQITGAAGLDLEAPAAFLVLSNGSAVEVKSAPLAIAESGNGLEDLFTLVRALSPPAEADRRADLANAFGPFQLVPALLDGAVAAHANLTLNGAPQTDFLLVRTRDARVSLASDTWTTRGNATMMVQADVMAADPGSRVDPPLVLPAILGVLALVARILTPRAPTPWAGRRWLALARAGGLVALALVASFVLARLLGFHPLLDWGALSPRSRVQLTTLVALTALAAWLVVGLSLESLARSAFAHRKRPAARAWPLAVGLTGALVFLLVAGAPLASLVARFVRL
jgi:hypothetical protein